MKSKAKGALGVVVCAALAACGQQPEEEHYSLVTPEQLGAETHEPAEFVQPIKLDPDSIMAEVEADKPLKRTYIKNSWTKEYGELDEEDLSQAQVSYMINAAVNSHPAAEDAGFAPALSSLRSLLLNANTSLDLVPHSIAQKYAVECSYQTERFCVLPSEQLEKTRANKEITARQYMADSREIFESYRASVQEDANAVLLETSNYIGSHGLKMPAEPYGRIIQMDGLLQGLDPHSSVLTMSYMERMQGNGDDSVTGIGVIIQKIKGDLYVREVLGGGGAAQAGVQEGDRIDAVDGKDVPGNLTNEEMQEVISRVKGKAGSKVNLTLSRDGSQVDVTVTRKKVAVKNVVLSEKEEANVLKYRVFAQGSGQAVNSAINEAYKEDEQKPLVIDLRGNPGGAVPVVVEISRFLTDTLSEPVFYSLQRSFGKNRFAGFYRGTGDTDADMPLIVLTNASSASASEVLTSNLKHLNRALVIGKTTFGKGTMQSMKGIRGTDMGYKSTVGMYFTAKHYSPQYQGVSPHVEAEFLPHLGEDADDSIREVDFPLAIKPKEGQEKFDYSLSDELADVSRCAKDQKDLLLEDYLSRAEKTGYPGDFQMELALATAAQCY